MKDPYIWDKHFVMELSPEVIAFIGKYIHSVEKLEILLIIFSSQERMWNGKQVFEIIRSTDRSVADRMKELANEGFITETPPASGCFRFSTTNEDLRSNVKALANLYTQRRIKVIEAIFTPRNDAAKSFSDAFKIRKG